MRKLGIVATLGMAAAAGLLGGTVAEAGDWPRYRGPNGDGRSGETGLLKSWPEKGPQVLWRTELGTGYSGISVADGRAFTLFGQGGDELVAAFDAATGKEIWRFRLDRDRRDSMGSGPRSTPTVADGVVYALGAKAQLYALEAATGRVKWGVDLTETVGARVPQWGVSTSPLVYGDLLLLDAGGRRGHSVIALERASGELKWAAGTDIPGYSSPVVAELAGVRHALFFTGTGLTAVTPDTGQELWRVPWKTAYDVNAAMPVVIPPDKVFISSNYDVGAAVYRLGPKEGGGGLAPSEVWRERRAMRNHFNSSVLVGDYLYGFDNGTLKCIVAATGEEKWQGRGYAKGSLLYADGHLIVLGERGQLALVEATPEDFREVARAEIFSERTWTMPTLANGTLYLRTADEMVALDLSAG